LEITWGQPPDTASMNFDGLNPSQRLKVRPQHEVKNSASDH